MSEGIYNGMKKCYERNKPIIMWGVCIILVFITAKFACVRIFGSEEQLSEEQLIKEQLVENHYIFPKKINDDFFSDFFSVISIGKDSGNILHFTVRSSLSYSSRGDNNTFEGDYNKQTQQIENIKINKLEYLYIPKIIQKLEEQKISLRNLQEEKNDLVGITTNNEKVEIIHFKNYDFVIKLNGKKIA